MNRTEDRSFTKDAWQPGEQAWFEYHCFESDLSSDADLWRRSHGPVTVVRHEPNDHDCLSIHAAEEPSYATLEGRGEAAQPCLYTVRFPDGAEFTVFEDELNTDPAGYFRPDPPEIGY